MAEQQNATDIAIERFVLGPFATNCYVVAAGADCWIIDAGFAPAGLIEHVRRQGLTPQRIILTHAHCDHMAGLTELRRAFPGAPAALHQAEQHWLTDPALNLSEGFGLPITAAPPEETFSGGETWRLGPSEWRVLVTPGHSPGGITLYCAAAEVALVGDTLFAGSIGRFDFPTSDQAQLERSIREVLYALPHATRVLPGHGPETTIGREKASNPFVRV